MNRPWCSSNISPRAFTVVIEELKADVVNRRSGHES